MISTKTRGGTSSSWFVPGDGRDVGDISGHLAAADKEGRIYPYIFLLLWANLLLWTDLLWTDLLWTDIIRANLVWTDLNFSGFFRADLLLRAGVLLAE